MTDKKEYRRKYREANKDKIRESNARHYEKNKDRYRELNAAWRRDNAAKMTEIRDRWKERHPERHLFHVIKMRAKDKGIPFDLTISDIVIPSHCPVLGIKLKWTKGRGRTQPDTPSVDRFDNTMGYVKGNIRIISWRANRLKSDGKVEEFEKIIKYMRDDPVPGTYIVWQKSPSN